MFVKVENKNPHLRSKEFYWYAKDNNTKMHYLFTESAMETAATRAMNNPEDIPVLEEEVEQTKSFIAGYITGCISCLAGMGIGYLLFLKLS